jgi:hypothetical protein
MRRLAAVLAVLLVTACTNEIDTSVRPESVIGTYRLRAYAGQTPPTQIASDSLGTTELMSGELVIGADKSWVESRVYRFVQGGAAQQYTFGSNGSWVFLNSGSPDMQFNDKVLNYQFTGTAAGGTITLSLNDGTTAIYMRP